MPGGRRPPSKGGGRRNPKVGNSRVLVTRGDGRSGRRVKSVETLREATWKEEMGVVSKDGEDGLIGSSLSKRIHRANFIQRLKVHGGLADYDSGSGSEDPQSDYDGNGEILLSNVGGFGKLSSSDSLKGMEAPVSTVPDISEVIREDGDLQCNGSLAPEFAPTSGALEVKRTASEAPLTSIGNAQNLIFGDSQCEQLLGDSAIPFTSGPAESDLTNPSGNAEVASSGLLVHLSGASLLGDKPSARLVVGDPPSTQPVSQSPVSSAPPNPAIVNEASTKKSVWNSAPPLAVAYRFDVADISEDGVSVEMDDVEIDANLAKLGNALVGKLLGKKIPFYQLKHELMLKWGHISEFQLKILEANCFMCIFDTVEARDAILCGGPWVLFGSIVGLDVWSSDFSPTTHKGFSSPLWVRMPNLPLVFWDDKNITRIATMLGQPIWLDAHTQNWERSNFVRVCVRMDVGRKLPTGVWIKSRFGRFFQRVEYEGITHLCFKCGVIGHIAVNCPPLDDGHVAPISGSIPEASKCVNPVASTGDIMPNSIDLRGKGAIVIEDPEVFAQPSLVSPALSLPADMALKRLPPEMLKGGDTDDYGPWTLVARKNNRGKGKSYLPPAVKSSPPSSSANLIPKGVPGSSVGLKWRKVVPPLNTAGASHPMAPTIRISGISKFSSVFNKVDRLVASAGMIPPSNSIGGGGATPLVSNG